MASINGIAHIQLTVRSMECAVSRQGLDGPEAACPRVPAMGR